MQFSVLKLLLFIKMCARSSISVSHSDLLHPSNVLNIPLES